MGPLKVWNQENLSPSTYWLHDYKHRKSNQTKAKQKELYKWLEGPICFANFKPLNSIKGFVWKDLVPKHAPPAKIFALAEILVGVHVHYWTGQSTLNESSWICGRFPPVVVVWCNKWVYGSASPHFNRESPCQWNGWDDSNLAIHENWSKEFEGIVILIWSDFATDSAACSTSWLILLKLLAWSVLGSSQPSTPRSTLHGVIAGSCVKSASHWSATKAAHDQRKRMQCCPVSSFAEVSNSSKCAKVFWKAFFMSSSSREMQIAFSILSAAAAWSIPTSSRGLQGLSSVVSRS